MLNFFKLLTLPLLLAANVANAQPTNISLEYEVTRNGKFFGVVKESYVQEGSKYRIHSTTKGKGIYALLGERVLTSKGEVTESGLKPSQFDLKRGDNERKSLSARFNWASETLEMLVKGKLKTAKLVVGTQDLSSYPYQFMFTPPKGEQVQVELTTGKKLKKYTYSIKSRDVELKLGDVTYQTLHLVNTEVDGKKKKEFWLGKSQHYIPVKYMVVDKHGDKIEQNITKIMIK